MGVWIADPPVLVKGLLAVPASAETDNILRSISHSLMSISTALLC
jgi:hypothetical protein